MIGTGLIEINSIVKRTYLSNAPRSNGKSAAVLALSIIFFSSVAYWKDWGGLSDSLPAIPQAVFEYREYWRLFTATAIHSNAGHLASNAFGMGVLSYLLVGYFGWAVFGFSVVVLAAGVNAISLLTYPPDTRLLGASGAVYVMAGFWLAMYVAIDRRFSPASRLMRAVGFSLVMLVPSTSEPDVSYRAHGIGFCLGAAFGAIYFLSRKTFFRKKEVREVDGVE